ncbi:MAG: hypothetical protein LBR90_01230 [Elusimicrobiota bacterium]|jgi:hypothetical protein|nr:hypothetical protein [Elusimicrobiota bacterium]
MKRALALITSKRGQQTVEFVMMLGLIVSVILAATISFHKEIAGGFFTIIGGILG